MADQDNTLNTIFTADESDVTRSINQMLADFARLGAGAASAMSQLVNPTAVLKEFIATITSGIVPTGLWEQKLLDIASAARLVLPSIEELSNFSSILGIDLTKAGLESSNLAQGLMVLQNYGESACQSLIDMSNKVGENSPKLIPFTQAIIQISDHLNSFPETAKIYSLAQTEASDSTTLMHRALQLLGGEITPIREGYLALGENVKTAGTMIFNQVEFIKSIARESKAAAKATNEWLNENTGNNEAIQKGIPNLYEHLTNVGRLKDALQAASIVERQSIENQKENSAVVTRVAADKAILTKQLLDETTTLQVLNGEYDSSISKLQEVIGAITTHRPAIQAMSQDRSLERLGVQESITLYDTLKEKLQLLTDLYGGSYASALLKAIETQDLNLSSITSIANAIEIYAQNVQLLTQQHTLLTQQNVIAAESIGNLDDYIKQITQNSENFALTLGSVPAILNGISTESSNTAQNILAYEASINQSSSATTAFVSASKQLQIAYQETNSSQSSATQGADNFVNAYGRVYRATSEAGTAQSEANRVWAEAAKVFGEAGSFINIFAGFIDNLVNRIRTLAEFQIASLLITGFIQSIKEAIQTSVEFDQTLHSLKAITGATSAEMGGMSEMIKNMASSSVFSTSQIGKGLEIMAQAGLSVSESISSIKAAANLATGTLEKMELTVDLLTSTMTSYQIGALEAGRVSDILAIAINDSKLSVDKLRTSLNYVGVIAAQSGLSLEQTSASLMILADRGMKASTIGTGLRQVLDKMIAPSEKLRDAYESSGIALNKISPLTVGYEGALRNLSMALYDTDTKTVDAAKAFELFGIRGAQVATILIQAYTSGEWNEAMSSFEKTGVAAEMSSEQLLGLSAMWDNLKAKVSVLLASLGEEGLTGVLKKITNALIWVVDAFQAFLNLDFGVFGTLFSVLTSVVGVLFSMNTFLALSPILLNGVKAGFAILLGTLDAFLTKLGAIVILLNDNAYVAFATVVLVIVAALKAWDSHLVKAIEKHYELANAANQASDVLTLFKGKLEATTEGSKEHEIMVKRLISEYPELAKELAKNAGVVDILYLSYSELVNEMEKLRQVKLAEAIRESIGALVDLTTQSNAVTDTLQALKTILSGIVWFVVTAFKQIGEAIATILHPIAIIINALAKLFETTDNTTKKMQESIERIAEAFVKAGQDINKSTEEQRATSLEKLNEEMKNGKLTQEVYEDIYKAINDSYDKIEKRLEATRKFNEDSIKNTNDVRDAIVSMADAYIKAGEAIGKSTEEQNAASLKKAKEDLKNGEITKETYRQMTIEINNHYKSISESSTESTSILKQNLNEVSTSSSKSTSDIKQNLNELGTAQEETIQKSGEVVTQVTGSAMSFWEWATTSGLNYMGIFLTGTAHAADEVTNTVGDIEKEFSSFDAFLTTINPFKYLTNWAQGLPLVTKEVDRFVTETIASVGALTDTLVFHYDWAHFKQVTKDMLSWTWSIFTGMGSAVLDWTTTSGLHFVRWMANLPPIIEGAQKLAEAYINAGRDITQSIANQEAASLKALEAEKKKGEMSRTIYNDSKDGIKSYYAEITELTNKFVEMNDLKGQQLSYNETVSINQRVAAHKIAIDKMTAEELQAIAIYKESHYSKVRSNSQNEGEIYKIHLDYNLKKIDLLSSYAKELADAETKKNELNKETEDQIFEREKKAINDKLAYLDSELTKEREALSSFAKWKILWSISTEEGISAKIKEINLARSEEEKKLLTLNKEYEQDVINIKLQKNQEYTDKLMVNLADLLTTYKTNAATELSLLTNFNDEKIKLLQTEASVAVRVAEERLAAYRLYVKEMVDSGKDITGMAEQEKELIDAVTKSRTDAINQQLAQGKILLTESNKIYDQQLAYLKTITQQEQELLNQKYTDKTTKSKAAFDAEMALIDAEKLNAIDMLAKKSAATSVYQDSALQMAEKHFLDELEINERDFNETMRLTNLKLGIETTYNQNLKDLAKGTFDFQQSNQVELFANLTEQGNNSVTTVKNYLQVAQALYETQVEAIKKTYDADVANANKSFEEKQTALLNFSTRKNNTVLEDVTFGGVALVKETADLCAALDERKLSTAKFYDGTYVLITQDVINNKDALTKITDALKVELTTQTEAARAEYTTRITDIKKNIDEQIITFKILTSKTDEELMAQNASWTIFEGKKYEIVSGTYEQIRELVQNSSKEEQATFAETEKKLLESYANREKAYTDLMTAQKAQLAAYEKENNESMVRIAELEKSKIAMSDTIAEAIRKNNQSIMTSQKKLDDDLLNVDNLYYQARDTLIKEDFSKFLAAIQALPAESKRADGSTYKSTKEMMDLKNDLFNKGGELFKKIIDDEIAKNKESIESNKKKFDDLQLSINELEKRLTGLKDLELQIKTKPVIDAVTGVVNELEKIVKKVDEIKNGKGLEIDDTRIRETIDKLLVEFQTKFTKAKPEVTVSFTGNIFGKEAKSITPISETIQTINGELANIGVAKPPSATVGFWGKIGETIADFATTIGNIIASINSIERTVTVTVQYVEVGRPADSGSSESAGARTGGYISSRVGGFIQKLKTGGTFSGQLPGYGGGDIVNAKLEPGEFVLRKEAVKQIGVNALRQWNNLNSSAGKSLNVQETKNTTESLFSGQLHTINLNVGDRIHRVYGESNVLNDLTSSMRRMRLMTA